MRDVSSRLFGRSGFLPTSLGVAAAEDDVEHLLCSLGNPHLVAPPWSRRTGDRIVTLLVYTKTTRTKVLVVFVEG